MQQSTQNKKLFRDVRLQCWCKKIAHLLWRLFVLILRNQTPAETAQQLKRKRKKKLIAWPPRTDRGRWYQISSNPRFLFCVILRLTFCLDLTVQLFRTVFSRKHFSNFVQKLISVWKRTVFTSDFSLFLFDSLFVYFTCWRNSKIFASHTIVSLVHKTTTFLSDMTVWTILLPNVWVVLLQACTSISCQQKSNFEMIVSFSRQVGNSECHVWWVCEVTVAVCKRNLLVADDRSYKTYG